MKNIKKACALILVILFSAEILGACGQGSAGDPTDSAQGTGTLETQTTTDIIETLDVPGGLNYNGYEFNILSAGNVAYNDFGFTEIKQVVLDDAQYTRKTAVEDLYGINININVQVNNASYGNGPGYLLISKSVTSNDNTYDLGLIAGYDVSVLSYNSFLYDLNSASYIDLSKSWWDQNANNDLSIGGIMFFTQGEITASNSEATFVIYYNKALGAEANIDDPYLIVKNGAWTLDVLGSMCRTVSEDLDGNDIIDHNDLFGLYVWDDSMLGMLAASGIKCCSVNSSGEIELTLYSEKAEAAFTKYADIAYDTDYALCYQRVSGYRNIITANWLNNQALFWATSTINTKSMREMNTDFGILPYPKLSEDQERYYSTVSPYNSQFICIPLIQDDIDRTGAVIETLAYYGQKTVTPAVYEKTLVGTYFRDDESAEMLDIIMKSYIYDIGHYLQIGGYNENIMNLLRTYSYDFTSMYNKYLGMAEKRLASINTVFADAISKWE